MKYQNHNVGLKLNYQTLSFKHGNNYLTYLIYSHFLT